jgi:hypothetical protein
MLGIIEAADEPAALTLAQERWAEARGADGEGDRLIVCLSPFANPDKFTSHSGDLIRVPAKHNK